jgi:hypothetical protein
MLGKRLIKSGAEATSGANTFASENFNTVLYAGSSTTQRIGGFINRGAVFNGSSSYISASNPLGTGNVAYSVSAWVYLNTSSHTAGIYTIWDGGTNVGTYLFFKVEGGKISIGNYGSSVTSVNSLSVGQWVHVAVTRDTSNNVVLYVNGSSDTTGTLSLNLGNHSPKIGALDTTTQNLNGKIDQVRIFNKALSSSEITTLYGETHSSTTISTTDIFNDNSGVALYQLDGNANDTGLVSAGTIVSSNKIIDLNVDSYTSGTTIDDSTSNNNDATIVGDVSYDNWLGRGRFDLQGSSDYLKIDASTTFNGATDLTLEGWFRPDNLTAVDHFFSIYDGGGSSKLYVRLNDADGDIDAFAYTASVGTAANLITGNSAVRVQANKWNHIVMTYADGGSGKMAVYINGDLAGSTTPVGAINTAGTEDLYIGVLKNYIGTYDFDGEVGEIRAYSSALTASEVLQNFNATRYYYAAYDGTASNITYQEATKFAPDMVWIKDRTLGYSHSLQDTVRGPGTSTSLYPDLTSAEGTYGAYGQISAFNTNGFTVASGGHSQYGYAQVNESGKNYVAWCFNAGSESSASNTDGTITSTVKANTDAGFSIVNFTSSFNVTQTAGHGLSSTPEMIIIKHVNNSSNWYVWTKDLTSGNSLALNSTRGENTDLAFTVNSSNFTTNWSNTSYEYIAYCFHSVPDYQKIGTYTSAYPNTTHVETGFEPAFVLIKSHNQPRNWCIHDNKRKVTNTDQRQLYANLANSEADIDDQIEFTSNGFLIRGGSNDLDGGSSYSYIYLAIAADPDTTTPTVTDSFDVVTYTGNGGTQSIETDFKPDLVWIKNRDYSSGINHFLSDSVRGGQQRLSSSSTNAQVDLSPYGDGIMSFDSNGFTIADDLNGDNGINGQVGGTYGSSYVAWCWKAGDHDDNLPQINTEGTIESTVSVNDAAGFSIVKYVGNATDNATVGTGLSSAAELVIVKDLDNANYWVVGGSVVGNGKTLYLNDTSASLTRDRVKSVQSNTFTLGSHFESNGNNVNFIAYCWYSVTGHSKIGSYTGATGSVSVTTGFQPRFLLIKKTNTSTNGDWSIFDSTRDTSSNNFQLFPNQNYAEIQRSNLVTYNSDGFTINNNTVHQLNNSGDTYIYMAFK